MKMRKISHRHWVNAALSAGMIVYGVFVCRWSWIRLFWTVRDLALAVAGYCCTIVGFPDLVPQTLNETPQVPYAPLLPVDFATLKQYWGVFWQKIFSGENFAAYMVKVGDVALIVSRILLPVVLLLVIAARCLGAIADHEEPDREHESKPLRLFRRMERRMEPVGKWIAGQIRFCREQRAWLVSWKWFWLGQLNVLTIAGGALAYYIYWSVSFDFLHLYMQFYKLSLDLSTMFAALPLVLWIVVAYVLYDKFRTWRGRERLRRFECMNRAFLDSLPLVVLITGKMRTSKTKMLTDMALSLEADMRDKQLRQMLDIEAEFPHFPWNDYGQTLRKACEHDQIRTLAGARQFALKKTDRILRADCASEKLYGYDAARYGLIFSNGIVERFLLDRMCDYAQLQFLYRTGCLIASNYSIREDSVDGAGQYEDKGNLPLWLIDFFGTPPVSCTETYDHTHRVDFDTLRLGRTVKADNVAAGAFEFGVVAHTEMGKDLGNTITNAELKAKAEEANAKNDMFIHRLKMCRHSSTVCFQPYFRYFGDEQRPESLGADARDLAAVLRSLDPGEVQRALHMLLAEDLIEDLLMMFWRGWYVRFRHNRADRTLSAYLLRKVVRAYHGWYTRKTDPFTYQAATVGVEDGTLDGTVEEHTYYISWKKAHANRYATDCFADIFAKRAEESPWSFRDSPRFAGDLATVDEILETNSYFGNLLLAIREGKMTSAGSDAAAPGAGSGRRASRRRSGE